MRRRLSNVPRPVKAGFLVFVMAYGLFSLTTFQLTGYEPETAAVTEGLVREGHFWDKVNSEYPLVAGTPGKGNHHYARTGLLQPLLEAPFFAAGHLADQHIGPIIGEFLNGLSFLWFYNPFVAALSAVAIFALVFLTRRSLKWASTIAALFVFASIAWPYSKIGMETTFMFAITTAFALGVWARRSPSALSWGLTGFATGAAVATKAYTALAVLPLLVLLLPTFLALDRRRQLQLGLAACLPVLLWAGCDRLLQLVEVRLGDELRLQPHPAQPVDRSLQRPRPALQPRQRTGPLQPAGRPRRPRRAADVAAGPHPHRRPADPVRRLHRLLGDDRLLGGRGLGAAGTSPRSPGRC